MSSATQLDMFNAEPKVIAQLPRGVYKDTVWHGTTWPLVWCEEDQRWYVARARLAMETLGTTRQALQQRLGDGVVMCKEILLITSKGLRATACFPFDDLPYVLEGIEPNACRMEVREDLICLKTLSRDVLRDVLIYGKMPEVLKERRANESGIVRYDEVLGAIQSLIIRQDQFETRMLTLFETLGKKADDASLVAESTWIELEGMRKELRDIKEDTSVTRAGCAGVLLQEPQLVEVERLVPVPMPMDGTNYCLMDGASKDLRYPGMVRISAGEVGYTCGQDFDKTINRVLKESRYNGAKHGGDWRGVSAFFCDDRKSAQTIMHDLIERAEGILEAGREDVYWIYPHLLTDIGGIPAYIKAGDICQYANDNGLFSTPMGL